MKEIEVITEEVLKEFGDRKTKGRIDFVLDTETSKIYPVPRNMEHKDFVPTLPGYFPKTSKFVPLQFRLADGEVREILTGASSYEAEFEVKHPIGQLYRSHEAAWEFIVRSNMRIKTEVNEVLTDFAIF